MIDIFKIVEQEKAKGNHTALCIIVSTKGSTPLKAGAKMLVLANGSIVGTIGGGSLEKKVIEDALEVIETSTAKLFQHHLLQEHGMCCGGTVNVYIESIMPPEKLYIYGAGHVGRALSNFATSLAFDVYVVDDRPVEMDRINNPAVNKIMSGYAESIHNIVFDAHTYIAIMTYDHKIDREILASCIKKEIAYLGMIGSRRKVEVTRKMFLSTQICSEEDLAKVDMPMGFDIKGDSPEEIAISILAKIIEVKNTKSAPRSAEFINSEHNSTIAECGF
ncbi:MAG: XdhC family protein [Bacteroidetes bacterium]|nr:XdhC family protein [Bacteroidota bacterium]